MAIWLHACSCTARSADAWSNNLSKEHQSKQSAFMHAGGVHAWVHRMTPDQGNWTTKGLPCMHAGGVHAHAERKQLAKGAAECAHSADVRADSMGPCALLAAPHLYHDLPRWSCGLLLKHRQLHRRRIHVHAHRYAYCKILWLNTTSNRRTLQDEHLDSGQNWQIIKHTDVQSGLTCISQANIDTDWYKKLACWWYKRSLLLAPSPFSLAKSCFFRVCSVHCHAMLLVPSAAPLAWHVVLCGSHQLYRLFAKVRRTLNSQGFRRA